MIYVYISIKILLAMVITAIPLYILVFVKPKLKNKEEWKNSFEFAKKHRGFFTRLKKKRLELLLSFSNGLVYSKSVRKIYLLMTLVLMLIVETIDTNISHSIAKWVIVEGHQNYDFFTEYSYLNPMLTHPVATLTSFFLTFLFLSYRIGNYILTEFHNGKGNFILLLLAAVGLCYPEGGRFILLAEILFILSFAAYFYPNLQTAEFESIAQKKRKKETEAQMSEK